MNSDWIRFCFCLNCSYKGINVFKVCYCNLPLNQRPLVYFSKLNASLLHYMGIIKHSFSDFLVWISNQCPPQCCIASSLYWWGEIWVIIIITASMYRLQSGHEARPLFCSKTHLFVLLAPGTTMDFLAALSLPCVSCGWCHGLKAIGCLSYSGSSNVLPAEKLLGLIKLHCNPSSLQEGRVMPLPCHSQGCSLGPQNLPLSGTWRSPV